MNSAFLDFQTRSKEVEDYFQFVLRLENAEVALESKSVTQAAYTTHEHEELLKTFKATCYLLLYNLVESTMRNAIEAIFEELRTKQAGFDDCRDELKREILKNFKKRDMKNLLPKLLALARDVVFETFELKTVFSGNLDAKTIKMTAQRFGFAEPAGNKFWMLQTVKDIRNDLAHGVKSFADVGRNASPSDLEEARVQTVAILSETLKNINSYLANQEYLTPPVVQTV